MCILVLCNTYCLASCLDIGQLCAWFTLVILTKHLLLACYYLLDYLLSLIGLPTITYWTTVIDSKKIPKGSCLSHHSHSSQSMLLDVNHCTINQLTHLPTEVLWLHLSSRHLVTSGNKSVMAQRLYHALHNANSSSSVVTNTPPPPPTPLTSTATSCPSTTENFMRPIISMSPALPSIPPSAITFKVLFQPELQSQLSSLMRQLIQKAIATRASQIDH